MANSLHALVDASIDYAGLFPPASLDLADAAENFLRYRGEEEAWMLSRFVCPAGRLPDLVLLAGWQNDAIPLAVLVGGCGTPERSLAEELRVAAPHLREHDVIECRLPAEARDKASISRFAHELIAQVLALDLPVRMVLVEPPAVPAGETMAWRETVARTVDVLADFSHSAAGGCCRAAFKLRTGSVDPKAVVGAAALADAICLARDAALPWKATAGLHHPLRHADPRSKLPVHGFINVLLASVLANVHKLGSADVEAVLEEDNPEHFEFTDTEARWQGHRATVDQIAAARPRSLLSFGSCSFDEPRRDLQALGWLPSAALHQPRA